MGHGDLLVFQEPLRRSLSRQHLHSHTPSSGPSPTCCVPGKGGGTEAGAGARRGLGLFFPKKDGRKRQSEVSLPLKDPLVTVSHSAGSPSHLPGPSQTPSPQPVEVCRSVAPLYWSGISVLAVGALSEGTSCYPPRGHPSLQRWGEADPRERPS